MIRIGCHLSPSKGLFRMGQDALSIRANTFQFFLRNPRGSKAKELDLDDAAALMTLCGRGTCCPSWPTPPIP